MSTRRRRISARLPVATPPPRLSYDRDVSDPIAEIIGDYRAFAGMQRDRLLDRGIDIAPYPLSHLAVRVAD
jgi:hypothetical protein